MDWNITQHAIEQYVRRYEPETSYGDAALVLMSLLDTATKNGTTEQGDQLYVSGTKPDCRMVVKDRNVLITVLPPSEDKIDEMEFLREAYEAKQRLQNINLNHEIKTLEDSISTIETAVAEIDARRKELKIESGVLGQKKNLLTNELERLQKQLVVVKQKQLAAFEQ